MSKTERFWAKVDKSAECWVWTGAKNGKGYGRFNLDGHNRFAHRVSFEWAHGPIPEGMFVDHRCLNKACVNPNAGHLRLVTVKQNNEHLAGGRKHGETKIRGITRNSNGRRWRAQVGHNGKKYYGGTFDTIEEAAEAAKALRLRFFTHNELDRTTN